MSEKQAAVEAKQEGEFTLKGKTKPKKPKQRIITQQSTYAIDHHTFKANLSQTA